MKTRLFEWASDHSIGIDDLAELTGYSERHLLRIKSGEYPVTETFQGRVMLGFMNLARSLFLAEVSVANDTASVADDDGAARRGSEDDHAT